MYINYDPLPLTTLIWNKEAWEQNANKYQMQGRNYLYAWFACAYPKKVMHKKDMKWIKSKK